MKELITPVNIEEFLLDREVAMKSLDFNVVVGYLNKYGEHRPRKNDIAFWAGVHRARLALDSMAEEEKSVSRTWLTNHGYETRGL